MDMNIVLYSTHCPRCNVLEKKLQQKQLAYQEIDDLKEIEKKGYLSVPILEINEQTMDFKEAVDWINSLT